MSKYETSHFLYLVATYHGQITKPPHPPQDTACLFCANYRCSSQSFTNIDSFILRSNPISQILLLFLVYNCGTLRHRVFKKLKESHKANKWQSLTLNSKGFAPESLVHFFFNVRNYHLPFFPVF